MYIRTKDWIYDTENLHYRWIENNKVYKVGWDVEKPTFEADVIKQSENLEELCDEFVIEYIASDVLFQVRYAEFQWAEEEFESDKKETLYGAIRVAGKGLIYVAKMNENGEFELI